MNNKKIKIAFISFSLVGGGAERNMINIANYFKTKDKNIDVDLIIFKKINDYHYEYSDLFEHIKPFYLLNTSKRIPKILYPVKAIELLIKLIILVKKNKYSIVIAAQEYAAFYATVTVSKVLKIKSILIVGNNIVEELNSKPLFARTLYLFLYRLIFYLSERIICVSYGLRDALETQFSIPSRKIVVIHNGIDIKRIKEALRDKLSAKDDSLLKHKYLLVTMGRLVKKKGYSNLIRAIQLVKQVNPQVKLFIIGKGPEEQRLKNLVYNLNLQNEIYFRGFIDKNPYIYLTYAKGFIFSSIYEGFGNVLVEAMACGLPILSIDCPYGPNEVLSSVEAPRYTNIKKISFRKYGILIPYFKNEQLQCKSMSQAIIMFFRRKKLQETYMKASLERCHDFSSQKMAEEYSKVIQKLL